MCADFSAKLELAAKFTIRLAAEFSTRFAAKFVGNEAAPRITNLWLTLFRELK